MNQTASPPPQITTHPRLRDRWTRRLLCGQVRRHFRDGEIHLEDELGFESFGQPSDAHALRARVTVHDPRFYSAVAFSGSVAAGEAYMKGWWSCDDLTALCQLVCRNMDAFAGMDGPLAWLANGFNRLTHVFRRNSQHGSRRNIGAHYDLGNEFFGVFLDETMMYSAALFDGEDTPLYDASVAKLDHICQKLELSPRDHLLEIGTGWGGFALHAAREYGCRVTTVTISRKQHEMATRRIADAGLQDRVTVLLKDYRELTGSFDKIVSIEMVEAVGEAFLDTYFRVCSNLLRPDGMMLLQGITIADRHFDRYRRTVDFIQRYIFPGGFLPSVACLTNSIARGGDLRVYHLEDFGTHYATTLRHWRQRFHANLDDVRRQGYSDEFIRMWEYYLCYCEAGFLEHHTGLVQVLLTKPLNRRAPIIARQPFSA
jgi:cyclopropane-fatty-acyl-phospholipid synthase